MTPARQVLKRKTLCPRRRRTLPCPAPGRARTVLRPPPHHGYSWWSRWPSRRTNSCSASLPRASMWSPRPAEPTHCCASPGTARRAAGLRLGHRHGRFSPDLGGTCPDGPPRDSRCGHGRPPRSHGRAERRGISTGVPALPGGRHSAPRAVPARAGERQAVATPPPPGCDGGSSNSTHWAIPCGSRDA